MALEEVLELRKQCKYLATGVSCSGEPSVAALRVLAVAGGRVGHEWATDDH